MQALGLALYVGLFLGLLPNELFHHFSSKIRLNCVAEDTQIGIRQQSLLAFVSSCYRVAKAAIWCSLVGIGNPNDCFSARLRYLNAHMRVHCVRLPTLAVSSRRERNAD